MTEVRISRPMHDPIKSGKTLFSGDRVLFDDAGEVEAFEGVDFGFECRGSVVGSDVERGLEYDFAAVADVADGVDGDSAACFAGGYHGLMDSPAIHSFAAVGRKQRRMDVEHTSLIFLCQVRGNHHQETGEHNHVDCITLEHCKHSVGAFHVVGRYDFDRYIELRGALNHSCTLTVAYDHLNTPRLRTVGKMSDNIFGI